MGLNYRERAIVRTMLGYERCRWPGIHHSQTKTTALGHRARALCCNIVADSSWKLTGWSKATEVVARKDIQYQCEWEEAEGREGVSDAFIDGVRREVGVAQILDVWTLQDRKAGSRSRQPGVLAWCWIGQRCRCAGRK